jgi:hypothetical protein
VIPGERIVELTLEIVKLAMEGQSIEQRQRMWEWYIEDVTKLRKLLKLDA